MNKTWIAEFNRKPGSESQNIQSVVQRSLNGFVITSVSRAVTHRSLNEGRGDGEAS